MNEKITFPRLASLLADRSGRSKRFSEDFLREFFALISERLEAGESVKVKGLGTFKLSRVEPRRSVDVTTGQPMEISGHTKVVFVPSKELAEAVNSPFEAFTAIEISDDADLSTLFTTEEISLQEREEESYANEEERLDITTMLHANEENASAEAKMRQEDETETEATIDFQNVESISEPGMHLAERTHNLTDKDIETDTNIETESGSEPESDLEPQSYIEPESDIEPDLGIETEPENEEESTGVVDVEALAEEASAEEDDIVPSRRKTWIRTLMITLGAAIFALICTFAVWYVFATNDFNRIFNRTASNTTQQPTEGFVVGQASTNENATPNAPIIEEDTISETQAIAEEPEVPTAPSDAIVYDTISTSRFLTTMAKRHYGNNNLWPYIYEENKAILGHPDRIRPGTPVVIPKLSKYGVDPTNSEDIEKAKKMGVEIYARYGKKI